MRTTVRMAAIAALAMLASSLSGCGPFGYSAYLARSQVADGMALSYVARIALEEFHQNFQRWPQNNAEAGLANADSINGKYVSSVDVGVRPGFIVVTYGTQAAAPAIRGKVVALSASGHDGAFTWHCDPDMTTVSGAYLPDSCKQ